MRKLFIILALLCAMPCFAAIAIQQHKGVAIGSQSGQNLSLTLNSNVTTGDVLYASCTSGQGTLSISDSLSNTFTQVASEANGVIFDTVWYAKNVTGGSDTLTCSDTSGNSNMAFDVLEISGLNQASPFDVDAVGNGSTTSMVTASAALTSSYEVLIDSCANANVHNGFTAGSGYTLLDVPLDSNNETMIADEYKIVTTGGSYAGAMTQNLTQAYACVLTTFAAAPTGGGSRILVF